MRRVIYMLLLGLVLVPATPESAPAQEVQGALIGGGVGVAGGAVITLSVIVARARFQREYIESADDLIHWQSTPMIAAPAAGVVFGLAGKDALVGSIIGSASGLVLGAAAGAGLGWLLSEQQEWPWAGGVIGAGVGLSVGGLLGGLLAWSEDEDAALRLPEVFRLGLSIPVR